MRLAATEFTEELKRVLAWLSKDYSADEVFNILANFWLNPTCLPTTETALEIYQAKFRAQLQKEKSIWQKTTKKTTQLSIPVKIVEGSRNMAEAVLIFLDGLEPCGIFDLAVKDYKIATCFCFEGLVNFGKVNQVVAQIVVDFGLPQKQKLEILADQIVRIPLKLGFTAEIEVRTKEQFKLAGERKISQKVTGTELGIIFDGRGRPIVPPADVENRHFRVNSWKKSLEDQAVDVQLADFGFSKS